MLLDIPGNQNGDRCRLLGDEFENYDSFKAKVEQIDYSQQLQTEFEINTVKKKLINLKKAKSPSTDGIHPMLLHSTADMIAKPLTDRLFRASFAQGVIPYH